MINLCALRLWSPMMVGSLWVFFSEISTDTLRQQLA
jgi:hypothetical protein